ncbi:MAG: methionine synthase [Oscillospiraceae bacterium]
MEKIILDKINREEAFRYMAAEGYSPEGAMAELADECEQELIAAASPFYTYRVFEIAANDGEKVTLKECPIVFAGKDISALLKGCHSAVVMCATVGSGADLLIRKYQIENMAKAFIADAFASAAAEQVCNKFDELLKEKYPEKFITWRFSPGYGDFPLDIQRELLDVLNAGRLAGICVNRSGMLTPIKSVTAVCGISDSELPRGKRGCASCLLKGECAFRKRGTRCEF